MHVLNKLGILFSELRLNQTFLKSSSISRFTFQWIALDHMLVSYWSQTEIGFIFVQSGNQMFIIESLPKIGKEFDSQV